MIRTAEISALLAGIALVLAATCQSMPAAGEPQAEEYAIKAAFLFNFAKFIEWPAATFPHPEAPLRLCVLGDDPFGQTLTPIADKIVQGRPLELRRFRYRGIAANCHILFISASEAPFLSAILKDLDNTPVVTVSDVEGFAEAGGIIGLVNTTQRIRFKINPAAAEKAGVRISSKLLGLATIVTESSTGAAR